jgi:hypothetical protein
MAPEEPARASVQDLSRTWQTSLLDALAVELTCELALPGGDADPEGAVTYGMTMLVSFSTDEVATASPKDQVALRALIGESSESADAEWLRLPVGHGHLVVCELGNPNLWEVLDSRESDLEHIASAILEPRTGDLVEDLDDEFGLAGLQLVIVNHVSVRPQWRGLGFGLLGTGLALQHLGGPASCAALYPMEPGLDTDAERAEAHARLSSYWEPLGFAPFRDGVHLLDLTANTLDNAMKFLRSGRRLRRVR